MFALFVLCSTKTQKRSPICICFLVIHIAIPNQNGKEKKKIKETSKIFQAGMKQRERATRFPPKYASSLIVWNYLEKIQTAPLTVLNFKKIVH